jgi:hypothetical protein
LTTEGVDLNSIVFSVIVRVLVKQADNRGPFRDWESCRGLDIISVLYGESLRNTYRILEA